jgi:ABC-type Mn2+/Zn2+ transport system ATPase subunit
MVSRSSSFSGDLIKILFGEILGAAPADLALQASALAGVLLLAWVLRRPFLLLCFSPEHARVSGYDPRVFHLLMLALIGGTVIVSFQTVGTMLVFGLLVAPAAAASLLVHRMGAQMAVAGLLGSLSVTAGLLLSYWGRFAAGATIVLVAVGLFFAILVLQGAWAALARFGRGREDGPGASAMGLAAALAAGGSGSPALQPPAPPRSPATVPALAFRGLDIGHDGQTLVRQLCLELPAGRTLVLTGGNGAGKTTLLRTIAGLIEPTAGSVSVFGRPAREASQQLAWLGQFHPANPLLPLRVRDVVRLARFPGRGLFRALGPADERAVDEALEFVGMAGLGKRTLGRLSGGQRQKVFLAYVLARQARLVLLDEPVQNLDQAGATLVGEAIRRWQAEGATIVMATHDPHEAGRADLVMNLPAAMVYTVSQEASQ